MAEYGLWVSFEDQSESFTLGFEAGMVYEKLLQGGPFSFMVHTENLPQLEAIAKRMGFCLVSQPTTVEGWADTSFERTLRRIK